jgi:hypothetical protein
VNVEYPVPAFACKYKPPVFILVSIKILFFTKFVKKRRYENYYNTTK